MQPPSQKLARMTWKEPLVQGTLLRRIAVGVISPQAVEGNSIPFIEEA
jgi:hypothetical protein